jgi:hypothetical protein
MIQKERERERERENHLKKWGKNFAGLLCDFDQQFWKCLRN